MPVSRNNLVAYGPNCGTSEVASAASSAWLFQTSAEEGGGWMTPGGSYGGAMAK
jgi:hypothetical protein